MRIMLFVDLENFRQSIWNIDRRREPKYSNFHYFLIDRLVKKFNWEKHNPRFIRCYIYTGEYTDSVIHSIKHFADLNQQKYGTILNTHISRKEAQEKLFEHLVGCPFVEIKTTPLKFSGGKSVYQKGVDVLLAVDLVYHSAQDHFDLAIVCSGDLDLLESIKLVKNMGKEVIIISNTPELSKNIKKVGDSYFGLSELTLTELDEVSEIVPSKIQLSSQKPPSAAVPPS